MLAWLIDEQVGRALATARRGNINASSEQLRAFDASSAVALEGDPRNMTRAGASAEIAIDGVLTEKPDFWAWYIGGGNTTYSMIARAIAVAAADPTIKEVVLRVSSPGGTVDGLWEALVAIERFRFDSGKKIRVVASKAQSAAYAIAAYAGKIEAVNVASFFGSIGTAIDIDIWADVKTVSITNDDSPDKRPDPETPEGRAVFADFCNEVNELFVDAIARGRGIEAKAVVEGFGRGRTFTAEEAKARGMIDSFPKMRTAAQLRANAHTTPTAEAGAPTQEKTMKTLDELKAQHPDLYAAAVAKGVSDERERCGAHLEMAKVTGKAGLKLALEAIEAGTEFTVKMAASYQAAGISESQVNARQSESDATGAVLEGADNKNKGGEKDLVDIVADALDRARGKAV